MNGNVCMDDWHCTKLTSEKMFTYCCATWTSLFCHTNTYVHMSCVYCTWRGKASGKALPAFLKFVVGCLYNLKFCCQYRCFCFLTEIQHPSMLCLCMPSPFQGTYGTSVYLSSSLCLQIAFNCCHHV